MRFFDEDNEQFEKTLIVLTLLFAVYFASYVSIRWSNTYIEELDGCGHGGCVIVNLPQGRFYTFYKPLVFIDERLFHAEFRFR